MDEKSFKTYAIPKRDVLLGDRRKSVFLDLLQDGDFFYVLSESEILKLNIRRKLVLTVPAPNSSSFVKFKQYFLVGTSDGCLKVFDQELTEILQTISVSLLHCESAFSVVAIVPFKKQFIFSGKFGIEKKMSAFD